ncbi:hypothetical protein ACW4TU_23900 [Streptomyces sp. QTS52]
MIDEILQHVRTRGNAGPAMTVSAFCGGDHRGYTGYAAPPADSA